jgi:hypothetical protein
VGMATCPEGGFGEEIEGFSAVVLEWSQVRAHQRRISLKEGREGCVIPSETRGGNIPQHEQYTLHS